MDMRFPAKKNAGCPKAPRDFPPRKDGILHSRSGCLGTSLPLPQSLYGRTLTSQPKFFGSIDYPGGSDELASSAGSSCLAIVTSQREKRASLPSLQKWRWQTDARVQATNVFFVLSAKLVFLGSGILVIPFFDIGKWLFVLTLKSHLNK